MDFGDGFGFETLCDAATPTRSVVQYERKPNPLSRRDRGATWGQRRKVPVWHASAELAEDFRYSPGIQRQRGPREQPR